MRPILQGQPGQKATPAPDNLRLTVTAPPEVLDRAATFIAAQDWPFQIGRGVDGAYKREDVQDAARSLFYACSIEDMEGVAQMLSPRLLAKLKGTNLTTFVSDGIDPRSGLTVLREKTDPELVRMLRGDWAGKDAAVRKVVQAWNRFPLRTIRAEGRVALGFGLCYFASAAFEGAPSDWVELSFIPNLTDGTDGPLMIDTLPPWLPTSPEREPTHTKPTQGTGLTTTDSNSINSVFLDNAAPSGASIAGSYHDRRQLKRDLDLENRYVRSGRSPKAR